MIALSMQTARPHSDLSIYLRLPASLIEPTGLHNGWISFLGLRGFEGALEAASYDTDWPSIQCAVCQRCVVLGSSVLLRTNTSLVRLYIPLPLPLT